MQTETIAALVGIVGAILGAIITQLLTRRKTEAEIEKIRAETEKVRAEADSQKTSNAIVAPPASITSTGNKLSEYKEHPLPEEIMSALKDLPELQKATVVKSYKDVKIRWHLNMTFHIGLELY
jgi:hypothetical protein